jgi:hypothetical protein
MDRGSIGNLSKPFDQLVGENVDTSLKSYFGSLKLQNSGTSVSERCEDIGWCVKHRNVEVPKYLCVVSNLVFLGHTSHDYVASWDWS